MKKIIMSLIVVIVLGVASFSCAIEPLFLMESGTHFGEATKEQVLKQLKKHSPRCRIECPKRVGSSSMEVCNASGFPWKGSEFEVKFKSGRLAYTQNLVTQVAEKDIELIIAVISKQLGDPVQITKDRKPMLDVITYVWFSEEDGIVVQLLRTSPHTETVAVVYTYLPLMSEEDR